MIVVGLLLRVMIRGGALVGFGWLVNHWFATGWVLGVCIVSVIDREGTKALDRSNEESAL